MYLLPGSKLERIVEQKKEIPSRLSSLVIQGFAPFYVEGKGYHHLCQHYAHDEVDLYIYHIYSSGPVELFATSTIQKWCLGYLKLGQLQCTSFPTGVHHLVSPQVLFFPTQPGRELQLLLEGGDCVLYCCCFTVQFSAFIQGLFKEIRDGDHDYPKILRSIDYSFQSEWDRLVEYARESALYPAFLAAQIRLLLAKTVQYYQLQIEWANLETKHPGIQVDIIRKAYLVRDHIQAHPGTSLDLQRLCKVATWNLQGLKTGFSRVFGVTPHRYIMSYRLELAATLLLKDENASVQAVSLSCGYRRVHHFIQQFKQRYGCTPRAYKDQFLKSKE